jgi:outer membrane protein TolC
MLATSAAIAEPVPLTLDAAVRAAQAHSQALVASQAVAQSARELAVAAAQLPDPVLRVSLDNVPLQGQERLRTTADPMTMHTLGVMQTFVRADKRQARSERLLREAEMAQAERVVRSAILQRETAVAWFERRALELRVARLRDQLGEAQLQERSTEAAVRGQRALPAEWVAARDAQAQVQQALLQTEADLLNARRTLARWTGVGPDAPLAEAPPLSVAPRSLGALPESLRHHPDVLQLDARERVAAAEAEVARREREPDWSAELTYNKRGSAYGDMVSVAVSLPLPWDRPQRQDRELAARLSRIDELRAERDELARERLAETQRWAEAWRAGLAQLDLIDREREPLAHQRTELALVAYRGGRAPLSLVLEARRMALQLQLERIAVELETARLWARLEFQMPDAPVMVSAAKE